MGSCGAGFKDSEIAYVPLEARRWKRMNLSGSLQRDSQKMICTTAHDEQESP
jgi:hypothetical protein